MSARIGIGARLRIASADQVMNLERGFGEIDLGVLVPADRFVSGASFILNDRRRATGLNEIDRLDHRIDAEWEQPVEVYRSDRIVGLDGDALLDQYRTGIETLVGPEPGDAGFGVAGTQRPVDRARAAMTREQGRMKADRFVARRI